MLAQNFKTAAELGITDVEQQALIKVLGMLERGEIDAKHFDMANFFGDEQSCGTVGCICGWAHAVSEKAAFPELRQHHMIGDRLPLAAQRLFAIEYGDHIQETYAVQELARPEHAALALRSYLTTGDARWDLALTT